MRQCSWPAIFLLLIASIFLLTACSDSDQNAAFDKIKTKLGLNSEQSVQLKPIFDQQVIKAKSILEQARNERPTDPPPSFGGQRPDSSTSSTWKKSTNPLLTKLQIVTVEAEPSLEAVLSAEQITTYNTLLFEELNKFMEENRPEKGSGRPGGGMPGGGMPGGGMPGSRTPW